jgi:hypothetical protein
MDFNLKRILKIFGISIFFLFLILYGFYRSKDLIFGVKIRDVNLTDGATYTESRKNIVGVAKNAVKLTLNGRDISIDQKGNWNEDIVFLLGYNVINIRAEDKFGHIDEKNYKIIFKP